MAVTTSLIMVTNDASSLATQRITLLTTSTDTADGHPLTVALKPLMSHKTYKQALYGLSCALTCVGTFGIISNILVLTNFLKIGFEESINISFFALGISDLGLTITMSWGGILNLLILTETRLPFNAFSISTVTVYWPAEGLEKTTTCITAYIAVERLVSVVFPLHVKKIMTRRKTAIVLGLIFLLVFGPTNMSAFIWKLEWVFDPAMNETILRSNREARDNFYLRYFLQEFLDMHLIIVVHFTGLTILWISTIFLAITLSRNIKARESSLGQSTTVASQVKNIRVIKTVLLIAGVYLACSTPKTVSSLIAAFDDRFTVDGVYFRSYMIIVQASYSGNTRGKYEGIKQKIGKPAKKDYISQIRDRESHHRQRQADCKLVRGISGILPQQKLSTQKALDAIGELSILEGLDSKPFMKELRKEIEALAGGKAPGEDNIPPPCHQM